MIAFHLYRLGAANSKCVHFTGDGADWIWDRVDQIVKRAGIKHLRVFKAVDICHVVSHISEGLKACTSWPAKERKKQQTRLKRMLTNGKTDKVINYLTSLKRGKRTTDIQDAINYIEKRRPLMKYDILRQKKLPIGSGAVESAIRQVINLRIKGPGIFWYEENIEAIMYLRAQERTGRWDEMMTTILDHSCRTRNLEWKWESDPMSVKQIERTQPVVKSKPYKKTG